MFLGIPTTAPDRWAALAQKWADVKGWGSAAKAKAGILQILKSRPPANADPDAITSWLNAWGAVSPVFMYPEWGWSVNGDNATASYNLGTNNSVTWTANSAGAWSFNHVTSQTLGDFMDELVSAVGIAADLSGFVFAGMFLHLTQAIADKEPIADLGRALKNDWDIASNSGQLAFSLIDGDWAQAWNSATQYGKDLTGITAAFAPGPAPDAQGNLTITAPKASAGSILSIFSPPSAKKAPPMAVKITLVSPAPGSGAAGLAYAAKATLAANGMGPAPAPLVPQAPAAPKPIPWYSKKILGPVTVGDAGILAGVAGVLAKVML